MGKGRVRDGVRPRHGTIAPVWASCVRFGKDCGGDRSAGLHSYYQMDPPIRQDILTRLQRAEIEHDVRILYACESGSRA